MITLIFAVATGVLATAIWWIATHIARTWRRLRLWRLTLGRRKKSLVLLRGHFEDGPSGERHTWTGRRAIRRLARSFRLEVEARNSLPSEPARYEIRGADTFVKYVGDQRDNFVHLVNAESGYGKTVFGITLTLLPRQVSREGLLPLYLDLGEADPDQPLLALQQILERLRSETALWGRPLFVFDALNETVDPEYFAEELATKREDFRILGAQLLFLFSFRHHSYPARLRLALLEQGFGSIGTVELLFNFENEDDLAFLPELVRDGGSSSLPAPAELAQELRVHAARSPVMPLSREDVGRYLAWRRSANPERRHPSPADLCVADVLGEQVASVEDYAPLARVGFLLLGQELKAATYSHIAEQTGYEKGDLEAATAASYGVLARSGAQHFRIESETAVRVLGALEVATRLAGGASPEELRGRTIYDVCAPYVPAALRWLQRNECADTLSPERLDGPIRAALRGRNAPYSFYATVLRSAEADTLEGQEESLSHALFQQMISAIDEDRRQSCRDSLLATGRKEPELLLDPVLDQLFEAMSAYGDRAVKLLLGVMDDPDPLIRSQAAYLLLDWIQSALPNPDNENKKRLLEMIPTRLPGNDGNLHFRFHQVEILERLLSFSGSLKNKALQRQVQSLLGEIAVSEGDSSEATAGYSELQSLVSLHAGHLAGEIPDDRATIELRNRLEHCISILEGDDGFWRVGDRAGVEASLECWEVCLGMAMRICSMVRQKMAFASFIERALDHDLWIVRWWAFSGMLDLATQAAEARESTLAWRWATRAVQQLYNGVEPIGLKHRQCALIKRLRDGDGAGPRIVREALFAAPVQVASNPGRREISERYYETMGASPDAYLAEFFRRLDDIGGAHAIPV